jgi:DNA-binding FrmR family transcriptional regulator
LEALDPSQIELFARHIYHCVLQPTEDDDSPDELRGQIDSFVRAWRESKDLDRETAEAKRAEEEEEEDPDEASIPGPVFSPDGDTASSSGSNPPELATPDGYARLLARFQEHEALVSPLRRELEFLRREAGEMADRVQEVEGRLEARRREKGEQIANLRARKAELERKASENIEILRAVRGGEIRERLDRLAQKKEESNELRAAVLSVQGELRGVREKVDSGQLPL